MSSTTDLKKRIIDISYKYKSCHISSCLNAVGIIDQIYKIKKNNEPFILSNGHAGLALYVVLEKYLGKNAEILFQKHGTHPGYDIKNGIYCSTGSLGHGIGIAVGMALINKRRKVYCLSSDGECSEGSFWEALRIASELKLQNLKIFVIANGFGAVKKIDIFWLESQIKNYIMNNYPVIKVVRVHCSLPYLKGIQGHYKILNRKEYKEIINAL